LAPLRSRAVSDLMSRYPACVWILAAVVAVPAAAKTAPSVVRSDVASAAAVAASYGAVTSVFRTPAHNREVGGVPNSYHLQGRAIDVARRPGVTHGQIAAALQRAGFRMIESLDEGDHSHFAFAGPGDLVRQIASASPPAPPVPEPPKYPPVAADNHGTLRIDQPAAEVAGR